MVKFKATEKFDAKSPDCEIKMLETALDPASMIPIAEIQVFADRDTMVGGYHLRPRKEHIKEITPIVCGQGADGIAGIVWQPNSLYGISFKYK